MATLALVATSCSAVDQRTPEKTLETFLEHVSRGEMTDACELVDEGVRQLTERLGGGCQAVLQHDFPPEHAQPLSEAVVDKGKITVFGDVATVAEDAVTVNGEAVDLRGFEGLVKHDGRWWVSSG